jgi:glucokinase
MSDIMIGIDLGGTRIKSVAIDQEGNILEQLYMPTRDGDNLAWRQVTLDSVGQIKSRLGITDVVVGISAPGIPNETNSAIAYMPGRLQGLEGFDWSKLIGHKTWVLNDAVSALMAEARFGVARNIKHAVLITLGTGVGGAILIDGKPYQGSFQKAGHIGHITLDHKGEPDIVGMPGSLEDAIGNASIEKRSLGRFKDTQDMLAVLRNGDDFARTIWLESVKKLAIGIACVTNVLSPQCIILAGGISEAGDDLFKPLESFLSVYEWRAGGEKTTILKSQFGALAGAIGAACFASLKVSLTKST